MQAFPPFKNLLFVLNPISGGLEKETVQVALEEFCSQNQMEYFLFFTSGENDDKAIRNLIQKNKFDLVVAIGGDGTVSLVANILNYGDIPLGIIPLGSGNGLSKDLHIPQAISEALNVLLEGVIRKIDSLELNGQISFHLSDLGFNARIVQKFSEGETRGPAAYVKIALQEYIYYEPFTYTITTDKETFHGPAFMLTIANANAFGSNAAINPAGIVDDGKFEICLIEPFPKQAAFGVLYDLYTNDIQNSEYSKILTCREATIIKETEDILQIDGEPVSVGNEIRIIMHKQSLPVLVPKVLPNEA
ncbi:diacylglycerol/lipid kinase family protein [Adhaeribacter aquaticus]|uniref:diacylglycerol/lipid kinase family protein n=1 Tax=Adhaeribacter aquaticus TaxID=299567 RepID=UPI00040BF03C|nr:diacylglycerol kinase family protein [Adhaeribacter aquaticus]